MDLNVLELTVFLVFILLLNCLVHYLQNDRSSQGRRRKRNPRKQKSVIPQRAESSIREENVTEDGESRVPLSKIIKKIKEKRPYRGRQDAKNEFIQEKNEALHMIKDSIGLGSEEVIDEQESCHADTEKKRAQYVSEINKIIEKSKLEAGDHNSTELTGRCDERGELCENRGARIYATCEKESVSEAQDGCSASKSMIDNEWNDQDEYLPGQEVTKKINEDNFSLLVNTDEHQLSSGVKNGKQEHNSKFVTDHQFINKAHGIPPNETNSTCDEIEFDGCIDRGDCIEEDLQTKDDTVNEEVTVETQCLPRNLNEKSQNAGNKSLKGEKQREQDEVIDVDKDEGCAACRGELQNQVQLESSTTTNENDYIYNWQKPNVCTLARSSTEFVSENKELHVATEFNFDKDHFNTTRILSEQQELHEDTEEIVEILVATEIVVNNEEYPLDFKADSSCELRGYEQLDDGKTCSQDKEENPLDVDGVLALNLPQNEQMHLPTEVYCVFENTEYHQTDEIRHTMEKREEQIVCDIPQCDDGKFLGDREDNEHQERSICNSIRPSQSSTDIPNGNYRLIVDIRTNSNNAVNGTTRIRVFSDSNPRFTNSEAGDKDEGYDSMDSDTSKTIKDDDSDTGDVVEEDFTQSKAIQECKTFKAKCLDTAAEKNTELRTADANLQQKDLELNLTTFGKKAVLQIGKGNTIGIETETEIGNNAVIQTKHDNTRSTRSTDLDIYLKNKEVYVQIGKDNKFVYHPSAANNREYKSLEYRFNGDHCIEITQKRQMCLSSPARLNHKTSPHHHHSPCLQATVVTELQLENRKGPTGKGISATVKDLRIQGTPYLS